MHYLSTPVAFNPRVCDGITDSAYSSSHPMLSRRYVPTLVYLGHVDLISAKSIVDPRFNEILSR